MIRTPKITRHKGKGGKQEMLPSRHAMAQLVKGDPIQRSMNNYAKLTPSGRGAPGSYRGIMEMGNFGDNVAARNPDEDA